MKLKKALWLCLFLFFAGQSAVKAQDIFANTKDPNKTKEKYTIFVDNVKGKKYEEAKAPLEWILENEPKLHSSIYIYGERVYKGLESDATDPAVKRDLQDKLLNLLVNRANYFGDEASVWERIGSYAYTYLNDREGSLDVMDSIYSKIYKLSGDAIPNSYLTILTDVTSRKTKAGVYTEDQFMARYDEISSSIEKGTAAAKEEEKESWQNAGNAIDQIMSVTVTMDCEKVKSVMEPKYRANPTDTKYAKRILKYMLNGKCTDDALFIDVVKTVVAKEPDYALLSLVAKDYLGKDDVDEALVWFEKAVKSAEGDASKQGETYLDIARVMSKKGRTSDARTYAYKAADTDAGSRSEAYSLIGHLYMQSGNSCKGTNPVEQRYCFLAAYDMYAKAGNSSGMSNAKAQFPSRTDIFTYMNDKMDQSVSVGCWIGGTTILRAR